MIFVEYFCCKCLPLVDTIREQIRLVHHIIGNSKFFFALRDKIAPKMHPTQEKIFRYDGYSTASDSLNPRDEMVEHFLLVVARDIIVDMDRHFILKRIQMT